MLTNRRKRVPVTAAERALLRAWSRSIARERAERDLRRDIAAALRQLGAHHAAGAPENSARTLGDR
jgi:predicted 2-oxoglutarate/Fe(II)-dependent dioxygenase YbiX